MQEIHSILSKEELKTRKQWLAIFLTMALWGLVTQIFGYFQNNSSIVNLIGAFSIVICAIFAYIQYHCIFKKHGTRWLTLFLFTLPLMIVFTIYHLIAPSAVLPKKYFSESISALLSVPFFLLSYKMLKINKRIKKARLASEEPGGGLQSQQ